MSTLHLFEGFGVELEYMLVDAHTLDVRPLADRLLEAVAGEIVSEVELDATAWSNELAAHVIEFKTNGPAPDLAPLGATFQRDVARAVEIAARHDARLLPGAMHPWMDPERELVLWPHEHSPVYEAFDAIFGCRGHGWANVQSVHLNLPFAGDDEFARLHGAIRLVLPLLPALAASSPVADARVSGAHDTRLRYYRDNCRRVPSVTGHVVPEHVTSKREYEREILERVHRDLEPLDVDGTLRHEWVNARGAIARFDRNAIEIRVLDVQEHPAADVAICAAITAVLRDLIEREVDDAGWSPERLAKTLGATIDAGERARVDDGEYLAALGLRAAPTSAADAWRALVDRTLPADSPHRAALAPILDHGTLSTRLLSALGGSPTRERLREVYDELARCLADGRPFLP